MPRPQNKLRATFSPPPAEDKITEITKPTNGRLTRILKTEEGLLSKKKK